ncbi:unnamed protein product [Lupinus luteus]|uniref:Uncharacterized protein n=1 Tax=Lupinus luteus TaxID=3873 RepID=A0AAV1WP79_LUPLU
MGLYKEQTFTIRAFINRSQKLTLYRRPTGRGRSQPGTLGAQLGTLGVYAGQLGESNSNIYSSPNIHLNTDTSMKQIKVVAASYHMIELGSLLSVGNQGLIYTHDLTLYAHDPSGDGQITFRLESFLNNLFGVQEFGVVGNEGYWTLFDGYGFCHNPQLRRDLHGHLKSTHIHTKMDLGRKSYPIFFGVFITVGHHRNLCFRHGRTLT